jgi:hypothetical protein
MSFIFLYSLRPDLSDVTVILQTYPRSFPDQLQRPHILPSQTSTATKIGVAACPTTPSSSPRPLPALAVDPPHPLCPHWCRIRGWPLHRRILSTPYKSSFGVSHGGQPQPSRIRATVVGCRRSAHPAFLPTITCWSAATPLSIHGRPQQTPSLFKRHPRLPRLLLVLGLESGERQPASTPVDGNRPRLWRMAGRSDTGRFQFQIPFSGLVCKVLNL